jgi:hypothetical protein
MGSEFRHNETRGQRIILGIHSETSGKKVMIARVASSGM